MRVARDVRDLDTCVLCGKLGSFKPLDGVALLLNLRSTGKTKTKSARIGVHPRCLVRGDCAHHCWSQKCADLRFITRLGLEEMGKIRRDDIDPDFFERLLAVIALAKLEGGK